MDVGLGYVLAALDGDDLGGGISWSGAACAVLACPAPGPACLSYQPAPLDERQQLRGVILTMVSGTIVAIRSTGACGYNRPCAHQYVGKYQSCMV